MLRPELEGKRELGRWEKGVSQEGVWEGGGSQEGGDGRGTVCVMLLCLWLNCKLPQGRVLVSFVPMPSSYLGSSLGQSCLCVNL